MGGWNGGMVRGGGVGGEWGRRYSIKFHKERFQLEIQPPYPLTYIYKTNIVSLSHTLKISQRLAFFPMASKILNSICQPLLGK